MDKVKNKTKKKILIVTAFQTHGAGSGALITTQAISYRTYYSKNKKPKKNKNTMPIQLSNVYYTY